MSASHYFYVMAFADDFLIGQRCLIHKRYLVGKEPKDLLPNGVELTEGILLGTFVHYLFANLGG